MSEAEEVLRNAIGVVLFNAMNYPEPVQARILGQDTAPLRDKITRSILASNWLAAHDERVRTEAALVQHLWNKGKPFCGDESARPWYPVDRDESLARPVCALCHRRAITYARAEERERTINLCRADIAEAHRFEDGLHEIVKAMHFTGRGLGQRQAILDALGALSRNRGRDSTAIRAVSEQEEQHD